MIGKALYLLQMFPVSRWIRVALGLPNKVRVAPSAFLLGRRQSLRFGRGTKIGPRCRLQTVDAGTIHVGERVWISSDVEMETALHLTIGSGTSIQRRCTINGATRIGANCILAPNVFISSGTHPFREIPHLPIREQERRLSLNCSVSLDKEVWIQDDCWLGTNVVVCPGVTIGKGSVIGANSVVTRDVAPYTIIAGNPGRSIGKRLDWEPPAALSTEREEDLAYILSNSLRQPAAETNTVAIISAGKPILFALAVVALERGIRLYYAADGDAKIRVQDREYCVVAGHNILELPATVLVKCAHYSICEISMMEDGGSHSVSVLRIETCE